MFYDHPIEIELYVFIDGSRAVCRIGLNYIAKLSKKVRLIDEVIVIIYICVYVMRRSTWRASKMHFQIGRDLQFLNVQ